MTTIIELIQLLKQLESKEIYYTLVRYLDDSVSIEVVVPGERWEIDINQEGEIQIEIFKSSGEIYDSSMLKSLFDRFSD